MVEILGWKLPLGRLVRFGVVGGTTALIYISIGQSLVRLGGLEETLASSMTFVLAIIFNFFAHKLWTFEDRSGYGATVPRYVLTVGCGFIIQAVVTFVAVEIMGLFYLVTQVLAIACVVSWNFLMFHGWVFRDRVPADARG